MSDEWKYKELPRAGGQTAPAKWDDEKKEWVPYTTVDRIEVSNFPDVQKVNDADVNARLLAIEQSNAAILTKLNGVLDTQVTGSIAEYGWLYSQTEPTPEESFAIGVRIESDHSMTTFYWNGSKWNGVV